MTSWINQPKSMNNNTYQSNKPIEHLLNNQYTKIEKVPGLKTSFIPPSNDHCSGDVRFRNE